MVLRTLIRVLMMLFMVLVMLFMVLRTLIRVLIMTVLKCAGRLQRSRIEYRD